MCYLCLKIKRNLEDSLRVFSFLLTLDQVYVLRLEWFSKVESTGSWIY